MAQGIALAPHDIGWRCNIVRGNKDNILTNFTSRQINDAAATAYLATIHLSSNLEIHHDSSDRNILIYRNAPLVEESLELREPHENVGNSIDTLMPQHGAKPSEPFIRWMRESRRDGLMLWLWVDTWLIGCRMPLSEKENSIAFSNCAPAKPGAS